MFQYIYDLIYGVEINNDNHIDIKDTKSVGIKNEDLIKMKKKLKKTIILKKHFFIPNIKELNIKKQELKSVKPKFLIKPDELIKKKLTLKKTIIKNEPIKNLFLEELKKAKEDIYKKKKYK